MFNIETYISPILLSYVDKYVRDFKPADAQVSLWAGGVTLHNLVLKADVLQQEVSLPFTLVSGRIHELLIQVPWTKIMSEPIIVTINTIECVLSLDPPPDENPAQETSRPQEVEAPPGYMQALIRRIVSNIAVRVNSLIVKYVHDDIVLSLNVKKLTVDSVGTNWEPVFADIDPQFPAIRRLVRLDDLTLCLDKTDSDGKIRFYQEPLLYRCQLDLRVLTKLVSASKRRATSLCIQLRSSKLAWGVTNEQLVLLLRLLRERPPETPAQLPVRQNTTQAAPTNASTSTSEPPAESWSEWAWSWVPAWDAPVDDAPATPAPVPVAFTAYFEQISLVLKVMENEGTSRKRARGILELLASDAVVKTYTCFPSTLRVKIGTRYLTLSSYGKCVCGHSNYNTNRDESTIYLSKMQSDDSTWDWREEEANDQVETGVVADENEQMTDDQTIESISTQSEEENEPKMDENAEFWARMAPILFLEYSHDREPSNNQINPYDNPPKDYEYSDWVENNYLKIIMKPMLIQMSTGLIHRAMVFWKALQEVPPVVLPDPPMRTLTVEECDALSDNLPLRRIDIDINGLSMRVYPWDHSLTERASRAPVALDVEFPKASILMSSPLYPHRVCSAACQMPAESGPLWRAAMLNITANVTSLQVGIATICDDSIRPCARADFRVAGHSLMCKNYFTNPEVVTGSYTMRIREVNVCGSAPRLLTAIEVPMSLLRDSVSNYLRYSTLPKDVLNDEDYIAVDVTLEDLSLRGFLTSNTNTHIINMHSARATTFYNQNLSSTNQTWLFSAPEVQSMSPFLRIACQWCNEPDDNCLEYLGVWLDPMAFSVDPLILAWLSYRPKLKAGSEPYQVTNQKNISGSQYLARKRTTPPSSSGRGGSRPGSGAEFIHRARSVESGSEPSEKKETKTQQTTQKQTDFLWNADDLLKLHSRLNRLLLAVETGPIWFYISDTPASAVNSVTVKDAIEQHALDSNKAIVFNLNSFNLHSNYQNNFLWQCIKHDGPTYIANDPEQPIEDSFPWRIRFEEMTCYTYELQICDDIYDNSRNMQTMSKSVSMVIPKIVLEQVTTTVTLSVVTKSLPTKQEKDNKKTDKDIDEDPASVSTAAVVSLGVNLHADTPPIIIRLDQEQIQIVAIALHCASHLMKVLQRDPFMVPKQVPITAPNTQTRPTSELERRSQSEDTISENRSEPVVTIFEPQTSSSKLKSFLWFQWVMSRATLVVSSPRVKLALDIDDIISSLDLQEHYNQFKTKISSASIRQYVCNDNENWIPGLMGGRVLEMREPTDAKEESHFLGVTVTQAQISNLPASWKDELQQKSVDKNSPTTMWEVYATLAPLEAVLQPATMKHITMCLQNLAPNSECILHEEVKRAPIRDWPFCYITAGGLRLLVTGDDKKTSSDDTFMFMVGKVSVNPHPENPICRRNVSPGADNTWSSAIAPSDGRQYEILIKNLAVRTARFSQLADYEAFEAEISKSTSGENPALKWSQSVAQPVITPVLHSLDVSCVIAPAVYANDVIQFGPAFELNLISDCAIELSIDRLELARYVAACFQKANRRSSWVGHGDEDKCGYASLLQCYETSEEHAENDETFTEEGIKIVEEEKNLPYTGADSGVETVASNSTCGTEGVPHKKIVAIPKKDTIDNVSDYMELLVTMGAIELSLYVIDNGSPEVKALRPPPEVYEAMSEPVIRVAPTVVESVSKSNIEMEESSSSSGTASEGSRNEDVMDKDKMEPPNVIQYARKTEGNLALIHITLQQPNLYFWQRKHQRTLQLSLFNAWIGLGAGQQEGDWNIPLITTAKGSPDPVTDIPPALVMLKIEQSPRPFLGKQNSRGRVQLDIDRPVLIQVSTDRLKRLQGIKALIDGEHHDHEFSEEVNNNAPVLDIIRHSFVNHSIESITVQTSQISVCGREGAMGWDSAKLQLAVGSRPERVISRILVSSLIVSAGSIKDRRHVVLQPLMIGGSLQATWDSWRRTESDFAVHEPTICAGLDLDRIVLNLRPMDLDVLARLTNILNDVKNDKMESSTPKSPSSNGSTPEFFRRFYRNDNTDSSGDQFYKDDLRSGAFKLVSGQQLPMAYQATLHEGTVAWRYPHPRAITRVVAFPIPGHDEEIECALELYCPLLSRWESQMHFKLPVSEAREIKINVTPNPVFATTWRVRACSNCQETLQPFEFDFKRFIPKSDPLSPDLPTISDYGHKSCEVTAEQLSGVLRIDSYFATRLLPSAHVAVRFAEFEVNAYNNLPKLSREAKTIEGYHMTRPLMRNHRVLSVAMRDMAAHALLGRISRLVFNSKILSDVVDMATGTMEPFVEQFRLQATIVLTHDPQVRVRAGDTKVYVHVPRVRTLLSLAEDWSEGVRKYQQMTSQVSPPLEDVDKMASVETLEGRIALWIHNTCSVPLRIGQQDTDEVVPLGSGTTLAYRWRTPSQPRKMRFSLIGPAAEFVWSSSILFTAGSCRVKLEESDKSPGVYLYVTVKESGGRRDMYLSGRLLLANMLRHDLQYKVRTRSADRTAWPTISSGDLPAESIGRSVLCTENCEAVLKLKFSYLDSCWSGDIPIKECRKENVPWLVKVPNVCELAYTSVWCRVVRARSDGRIVACIWPFYVLRSYLPLDAEVTITTESGISQELPVGQSRVPATSQTVAGRGAIIHLDTPGTTSAHHVLTLQYKDFDSPITPEAIQLHYGVTDTSVFDKPTPTSCIENIVQALHDWLARSSERAHSMWPYSTVTKHWPHEWESALLQPRCDVAVRYVPIRIGGGCSLEVQLCPLVLLANASPITLTLRAHDAAPLCKLEPGVAVSLPSSVLQKPYFMSVEVGRETFVSGQLQMYQEDPGRYGAPPPGHVALDRPAHFAVHCGQKVALLTMYYEIKEEINVLGITSSYVLINRLDTEILIAAIAVPEEIEGSSLLRPKRYKVIEPSMPDSVHGTPLGRFWVHGRWRGGHAHELRPYLCVGLCESEPAPVRLGLPPFRRALAVIDGDRKSIPLTITQVYHEGRWIITIAKDDSPQYFIHNFTKYSVHVAQPLDTDEPGQVKAAEDCAGARWWCTLDACSYAYYTTPSWNARYPPTPNVPIPSIPFLTVARAMGDSDPVWCQPVAMADGEQLLQLPNATTIKVCVRTNPHSTAFELQDVDTYDISASDIRRRLTGPFATIHDKGPYFSNNKRTDNSTKLRQLTETSYENTVEIDSQATQTQRNEYNEALAINDMDDSSLMKLSGMVREDIKDISNISQIWPESERARCVFGSIVLLVAAAQDSPPLLALHLQRAAVVVKCDGRKIRTTLSICEVQMDNAQYETEQYDFAVVAHTRSSQYVDSWPAYWGMFHELSSHHEDARFLVNICHDRWRVCDEFYTELTEVDLRVGPLALYIEDSYVSAAVDLFRLAVPVTSLNAEQAILAETRSLQYPLRLRKLHIHPLDLTLTLHTAVRMYIALDQSPLRLSAFTLTDMMTSPERLTHALTVHYLSAAILGAGWVVGGLELLGAPGALAARVGGASGGVRGVASAAAAALLKSLSACAGSLARNLDLLAGDEEHARRAAAARRRPPPSLMAGLVTGVTNFAINILGAVGGLAHHPLVGVAVGESAGAAGLRRGLLGALAKPLSATADLVAYAGQGLLAQTGWDPVPQPRFARITACVDDRWRRDCVRWSFRLAELAVIAGFEAQLNDTLLQLLVTHKFLVIVEPETERVVEMLDMRSCSLGPYDGNVIQLNVTRRRRSKVSESQNDLDEENDYEVNAAAMARVARYTGAEGSNVTEARVLPLVPGTGQSHALHAVLSAAIHSNSASHFSLI
ncbi:vacuolar protein sorting-associated protein 13B isoform X2 [Aricia agestis]|uniref:vacuolar protein sorting-associated protein 13B isoform X2 n=1 Tax=Aricia agestis TaxID=91739 RepID=UPI001C20A62F|nr:vacuolar protein sorting-associated protein 13B isoform X2 [Aricia agestis]